MSSTLRQSIWACALTLSIAAISYWTSQADMEAMRTREMRKDLFIQTAERLGVLLAERMEDAEGWHDTSRIDPARKQLGGEWQR